MPPKHTGVGDVEACQAVDDKQERRRVKQGRVYVALSAFPSRRQRLSMRAHDKRGRPTRTPNAESQ